MFRSYGIASAFVLLGFLMLNYFMPIPAVTSDDDDDNDGGGAGGGLDESAVATYGQQPPPASFGTLCGVYVCVWVCMCDIPQPLDSRNVFNHV